MFRTCITIALRNLRRNPLYSLINMAGLAIGMTCVVLVVLFVKHEFSFDSFHQKAPQLYRITTTFTDNNGSRITNGASGQVQGPAFKEAIPEILDYVRFWNVGGFNIIGEQKAFWLQGYYADSSFFRLLSFPLLHGNAQTALTDKYSIVLSERTALKYFGKTDVVGKTLKIEENGFQTLTVTAVAKEIPSNSSIRFEAILPFQFLETFFKDDVWLNQYLCTFVLLHPQADPRKVEQKFPAVFQAKANQEIQDARRTSSMAAQRVYGLQPIAEMHLNTTAVQHESSVLDGSTWYTLYLLSGISVFILLMACINFINLTIAHSLKRAKEIGIRKINGSNQWQIIVQFLAEAALLCIAAFGLAIVFSQLLLPLFNSLTGRQLQLNIISEVKIWTAWTGIIAVSIIMAGLYPAFVLSRFNAIEVLYNKQKTGGGRGWLGKSLVIFQFTLAIGFITASLVYYLQMNLMMNKDLGYESADIITVQLPPQRNPDQQVKFFRNELATNPYILKVAGGNYWGHLNPVKVNEKEIISLKLRADEFYVPMLKIPIIEGRNFSSAFGTDSTQSVIVNETFVKMAGWENPIGQRLQLKGEWEGDGNMTVVGVVKDYHYKSLKEKIDPQILVMRHYEKLYVKTQKGKTPQALATIENMYKKHLADSPFQFSFLDEDIKEQYSEEKHWQQIIGAVTLLAVFICCMGLFGLSYLAVRQRTREIGIRKVLGAGVAGIAGLISKDFLRLVCIAFLIASSISWLLMNKWLDNFAYRISISWWMFGLSGLITVIIALLTVGFQSVKAALMNPVKSLRSD